MEIYVKRKTLYLGWLNSLKLKFNDERLGLIQGKNTHRFSIPEPYRIINF